MATKLPYTQDDFSGGINLLDIDTKLQPNQYRVGINVRTRFGPAQPVKDIVEIIEGLPSPLPTPQGLYSFGNLLVLFSGGLAYYRLTTSTIWTQVVGFAMSSEVSRIYCQAVPEGSLSYNRVGGATPSDAVTLLTTATTPNPVSLVVQDGINQPWLIFADGSARVSCNYDEWGLANKEYVPIGRQMVWFDGILFIVSPDGKRIYRSVTGRPLDFVVAINDQGFKVNDAVNTSFAVDSNEIKLLTQLNADSLIVVTSYTAYAVQLNTTKLIYDEPTFNQTFLFQAGISNQFSFADILGDFTFIDKEGVRSFNAVSQLRFEGNNSVFSLSVAELFKGIIQTNPCVGSFDNYTFFSVKTTYSANSILVFDNIKKVFSSIDIITPQPVTQFAATYDSQEQRFFCVTATSVYELYSSSADTYADAVIFTRALNSRNSDLGPTAMLGNVKTTAIKMQFAENLTSGAAVKISEIVNNNVQDTTYTKTIPVYSSGVYYPVSAPVMMQVSNYLIPFDIPVVSIEAQKISYSILWSGGAKLIFSEYSLNSTQSPITKQQQETVYSS